MEKSQASLTPSEVADLPSQEGDLCRSYEVLQYLFTCTAGVQKEEETETQTSPMSENVQGVFTKVASLPLQESGI